MTNSNDIELFARDIVYDHLINGVEYLLVSEKLSDDYPEDPTDEIVDAVFDRVHTILDSLSYHVQTL